MTTHFYSPVLKGKANDLKAFAEMPPEDQAQTKPLIDIRPVPRGKSIDEHIGKLVIDMSCFPMDVEAFLDFYGFLPGQMAGNGVDATLAGYDALFAAGKIVTPVYGFGRDDRLWPRLRRVVAQHGAGFCFRLEIDDLDDDEAENTWDQILTRSAELGVATTQIDLFIDTRDIRNGDVDELQEKITDFLALQPVGESYRSICVAGSSAPKDVTVVNRDTVGAIYRNELKLWVRLKFDVPACTDLVYGDYGVVHPDFAEDVPCGATVNCKIRHTAGNNILIFRGHQRAGDSLQTHGLAAQVVEHAAYQGEDFSVGDKFISDCAVHAVGPGSPGNWVFVDMNHHLTYVTQQIGRVIAEIENDEEATIEGIEELLEEY